MNGLYVTLCVSFLLVMAKFNNAHGLTTFGGKSQNSQQLPPLFASAQAKSCTNHTQCKPIAGTSCIPDPRDVSKKYCLCGDFTAPNNGRCPDTRKGAGHLCSEDSDCVEDASCITDKANNVNICKCNEDFIPTVHGYCSGATSATASVLIIVMMHLPSFIRNA